MKKLVTLFVVLLCAAANCMAQAVDYASLKAALNSKSIPLINLTVDIGKVSKPEYTSAKIEIADPEKRTDGNVVTTLNCKVKYRGASSLSYAKKSFAIKLLNEKGKSLEMPMFGIRSDDSWILDAMAIDRLRMRNRINFDIWNDMDRTPYKTDTDGRNGTAGLFVELFINGKYHGLYCFSDKVNRKLLGVKKAKEDADKNVTINGVVYKCADWGASSKFSGYNQTGMDGLQWNAWELDYPDDYPCAAAYMPLKDFIDYCAYTTDQKFISGMDEYFYIDNFIDYHVFLLSQGLEDNSMKNSYLSIVNVNDGHRALITPWDLDCSLGGWWQGDYNSKVASNGTVLDVKPYERLWNGNINGYRDEVANRWRELCRKGILSPEGFNERLNAYVVQLKESGAWKREYEMWNNNPVPLAENLSDEALYVKVWYKRNYDNLENKIFKDLGTTGLTGVVESNDGEAVGGTLYNIAGQKVDSSYHGIIIKNGRKYLHK